MDFELSEDDASFLNNTFPDRWKTIVSGVERGIAISPYHLPKGYNLLKVNMMILIPQNYPVAKLDMFYLSPEIAKTNDESIAALNNETHFDRAWQRWSRHYSWQAGIHNIATHLQVVKNSLEEELLR